MEKGIMKRIEVRDMNREYGMSILQEEIGMTRRAGGRWKCSREEMVKRGNGEERKRRRGRSE